MEQQSSAAMAAQRVQAIIEAAEETAREIKENARAEAAGLVEQAARLRARMEEIEAALVELQADVDSLSARPTAAPPVPDVPEPDEPEPASADPDTPASEPEAASEPEPAPADGGQVPEGARLIALNMALNGTPREETARYLRENFKLKGADALLDEVYAKAAS